MAVIVTAMTGCCNTNAGKEMKAMDEPFKQNREFMDQAIKHRSPDVFKADIVGNTVIFTHIHDGIIDEKSYTYEGDVCIAAERVYTFPNQMRALRHYRRAVEKAELYDKIEIFDNQVKYKLKEGQYKIETEGLTKDQLKAEFDKNIADVKADVAKEKAKIHEEWDKHHEKKHDRK